MQTTWKALLSLGLLISGISQRLNAAEVFDEFGTNAWSTNFTGKYRVADEFADYLSSSNGTLRIASPGSHGVISIGSTNMLWNLFSHNALNLRYRALPGNGASNFWYWLMDDKNQRLAFKLPLTNTAFVDAELSFQDAWIEQGFNARVAVMLISGDPETPSTPFGLEIDSAGYSGSPYGPPLTIERITNGVLLRWPTNAPGTLQSSGNPGGPWSDDTNAVAVGDGYLHSIIGTRYFRVSYSASFSPAAVTPPGNPPYSTTFIDVSKFTSLSKLDYDGGANNKQESYTQFEWNSHNGGFYHFYNRYEEPPGTVIDTEEEQGTYAVPTNSVIPAFVSYAKFSWRNAITDGNVTSIETRDDETTVHLHVANNDGKPNRWVAVSVTAHNVVGRTGDNIVPFYNAHIDQTTALRFDQLKLFGEDVNADFSIFKKFKSGETVDATPQVTESTNYNFRVAVDSHKVVPLTWTYHDYFNHPTNSRPKRETVQNNFDFGSQILAKDDDTRLSDAEAVGDLFYTDDVPFFVEFIVTDGPLINSVFTHKLEPVFEGEISSEKFFNIRTRSDALWLATWNGSNVKIVRSIYTPEDGDANGVTAVGMQPARIVLVAAMYAITPIHEWGHACGLAHRGDPGYPGPVLNGIMSKGIAGVSQNEIHRDERTAMRAYRP